jgi:hypothetical protein
MSDAVDTTHYHCMNAACLLATRLDPGDCPFCHHPLSLDPPAKGCGVCQDQALKAQLHAAAGGPKRKPKGARALSRSTHDCFRSWAEMADLTVKLLTGDTVANARLNADSALKQRLGSFLREAAAHVLQLGEQDRPCEREVPQSPSLRRRT